MLAYTRHACLSAWLPSLEAQLEALDFPKCVLAPAGSSGFTKALEDTFKVRAFTSLYRSLVDLNVNDQEVLDKLPEHLGNPKPLEVILKPLKQRFKYHFMGSKKTNNPLKPEWLVLIVTFRKSLLYFY